MLASAIRVSKATERVFAQVSGLPPWFRDRCALMVIQAYVDESQDDQTFVMAGYVASAEAWAQFSDDWAELLPFVGLDHGGVRRFKMREVAARADCDWITRAFYRVIEKHRPLAISIQFSLAMHKSAMRRITVPRVKLTWKGWNNPYVFAFRVLTDTIHMRRPDLISVLRPDAVIDFIFDERHSEPVRVAQAWQALKTDLPPEVALLYGAFPRFEDDTKFLPLQAADLWAWWIRKWQSEGGEEKALRIEFPWESNPLVPPKMMLTLTEDLMIAYLVDKMGKKLPAWASPVILER